MRLLSSLAVLTVGLFAAQVAHADVVTTFVITDGTLASGDAVTGTVTIDTTLGTFVSEDIVTSDAGTNYVFSGPIGPGNQGSFNGDTQYYGDSSYAPPYYFDVDLPVASLVGYAGGAICTNASTCPGDYAGGLTFASATDFQATGSLVAATPEPGSLIRLGTGTLSLAGAIRRRLQRA
jgi:hypothetical protein